MLYIAYKLCWRGGGASHQVSHSDTLCRPFIEDTHYVWLQGQRSTSSRLLHIEPLCRLSTEDIQCVWFQDQCGEFVPGGEGGRLCGFGGTGSEHQVFALCMCWGYNWWHRVCVEVLIGCVTEKCWLAMWQRSADEQSWSWCCLCWWGRATLYTVAETISFFPFVRELNDIHFEFSTFMQPFSLRTFRFNSLMKTCSYSFTQVPVLGDCSAFDSHLGAFQGHA